MNDNVETSVEETTLSEIQEENSSVEVTDVDGEETSYQEQVAIEGEILPDETSVSDESVNTSEEAISDENTEVTTSIEVEPQVSTMSIPFIGLSALQCVIAFFLIVVVLQQSKTASSITSSAIIGGSDQSYWNKNKGRSKESKLAKMTVILGVIFFIVTITLGFVK